MPMDKDARLIAELSPMGAAAMVTTTAAVTLIPAIVQNLIGKYIIMYGRSMMPAFPKRSICEIENKPFEQLKIGDIPSVRFVDKLVVNQLAALEKSDPDYQTLSKYLNQWLGRQKPTLGGYAHRIIQQVDSGFITKGDNIKDRDTQILTKQNYQGHVVTRVVLDISGRVTGRMLEAIWLILKNYKPLI